MLYFAYGSNMSTARMLRRLPSAQPLYAALLQGFELNFHKRGMDGSAKCNALFRHDGAGVVHGAVYEVSRGDKRRLDRIEGLGRGYREMTVEVRVGDGPGQAVLTYLATHIDGRLNPFSWYLEHVVAGAQEWGLPREYIAMIRSVESIRDPDARRETRERAIHVNVNR